MNRRIIGLETEWALTRPSTLPPDQDGISNCDQFLRTARKLLPHLNGSTDSGIFMLNGGRLYIDTGGHPEICTPESDSPTQCITYAAACDSIMRDTAIALNKNHANDSRIFKCNVDYSRPGITWACHESYSHQCNTEILPEILIAHFVTRTFCGAGGLNPLCPGIQFSLSPRVHLISKTISENTTSDRGIYNTKNEALSSGGYRRLHVICADSVCSQTSLWLRLATTSLILAMAEADITFDDQIQFKDSVHALHHLATDTSFKATASLSSGKHVTALDIQQHYCDLARSHLNHPCMPTWAEITCDRWDDMLTQLRRGPDTVATKLDWAIKYTLFKEHISRSGFDPSTLDSWNHALSILRDEMSKRAPRNKLTVENILSSDSPVKDVVDSLAPLLADHGYCWQQVEPLFTLRNELCELDVRFSQMPGGLFEILEPHLNHKIVDNDQIINAKTSPPQTTRAKLRGEYIKKYAGKNKHCTADWHAMIEKSGRILDLSDPFTTNSTWRDTNFHHVSRGSTADTIEQIRRAYNFGDFHHADHLIRCALETPIIRNRSCYDKIQRFNAWVQGRRGFIDKGIEILNALARGRRMTMSLLTEYVSVYRFQALIPSRLEALSWLDRGERLLAQRDGPTSNPELSFLNHKGYILSHHGRLDEAETTLRKAVLPEVTASEHPRIVARTYCDFADVLRIQGKTQEALQWITEAENIFRGNHFRHEYAVFCLLNKVKLENNPDSAPLRLRSAKRMLSSINDNIGYTRALLLEARFTPSRSSALRKKNLIIARRESITDLQNCSLLTYILEHWDQWFEGQLRDGCPDPFWLI